MKKLIGWVKSDTQIYLKRPKKGSYLKLLVDISGDINKYIGDEMGKLKKSVGKK